MTDNPAKLVSQYLDGTDGDAPDAMLVMAGYILLLEADLKRCQAMVSRGHVRAAPVEAPRPMKTQAAFDPLCGPGEI